VTVTYGGGSETFDLSGSKRRVRGGADVFLSLVSGVLGPVEALVGSSFTWCTNRVTLYLIEFIEVLETLACIGMYSTLMNRILLTRCKPSRVMRSLVLQFIGKHAVHEVYLTSLNPAHLSLGGDPGDRAVKLELGGGDISYSLTGRVGSTSLGGQSEGFVGGSGSGS